MASGAGSKLKWGVGGGGNTSGKKKILSYPPRFLALQEKLVVLVSAFVMVSTVWFLVCSFSTHSAPMCKIGGHVLPRVLWSQRQWLWLHLYPITNPKPTNT